MILMICFLLPNEFPSTIPFPYWLLEWDSFSGLNSMKAICLRRFSYFSSSKLLVRLVPLAIRVRRFQAARSDYHNHIARSNESRLLARVLVFMVISRRLHKVFVNRKNTFLVALIRVVISYFLWPFGIRVDPRCFTSSVGSVYKNY